MSNIDIETAQNVVVRHEVASVGHRIVAYLLDGLILCAWIFLWIFLLIALQMGQAATVTIGVVLVMIPYMFYHLVFELVMDGRSIGKMVMNIKVARVDGQQPRLGQYLLRWILRPVDGFYGLGLLVILVNGRGQRLGDLAAGTTVVSYKQRMRLQDTLMTAVPTGHVVRFPEVVRLSDAQAAMIKEVLYTSMETSRWALQEEMAEKVRKAIGNNGDGLKTVEFLQTVLKDFVYLTAQQGQTPTNR